MKATLNTYRQSPRKVRLLADLIRGKKVRDAFVVLQFADKRAAPIMSKLLKSALSNAINNNQALEADLFVKEVSVNQGATLKRMMPRARGTGARINKRTSHIDIVLGTKSAEAIAAPKTEAKVTKKTAVAKVKKAPKAKSKK